MTAVPPPLDPGHVLDHYGACTLAGPCRCNGRDHPWVGRSCPHWRPSGATSIGELMDRARRQYEAGIAE